MKKVGLIGGIGPESTVPYYLDIVYGIQKRVGRPYFPELVIESLSVFRVLEYCRQNDRQGLADYMVQGIRHLAAAGADFAVMTGNTPHMVFDEIAARSPIPLLSIVEASASEAARCGYHRLGLLGTGATMRGTWFQKPFEKAGMDMIVPQEAEIAYIADKIENEIEYGKVTDEVRARMQAIVDRLIQEEHIDALVLGCTELPLVFQDMTLPVPVLDTRQIHIQAIMEKMMEKTDAQNG